MVRYSLYIFQFTLTRTYLSLILYLILSLYAVESFGVQGYNVTPPAVEGFEDVASFGLMILYLWYYFLYALFFAWVVYCLYKMIFTKDWLEFHHKIAGLIIIIIGVVTKVIIWFFVTY
jgi:hypothetical protein